MILIFWKQGLEPNNIIYIICNSFLLNLIGRIWVGGLPFRTPQDRINTKNIEDNSKPNLICKLENIEVFVFEFSKPKSTKLEGKFWN